MYFWRIYFRRIYFWRSECRGRQVQRRQRGAPDRKVACARTPTPAALHRLNLGIADGPVYCAVYGQAGTQNDRLGEAAVLSTGTPIPAQQAGRRRCRERADIELRA